MNILNEYLTNEMRLSASEQKLIIFKFKCIIYELTKFFMISIFFAFAGLFREFLFACMISIPLRIYSGGLHFKHYLSCFLFSFGYFILLIYGFSTVSLPVYLSTILMVFCSIINFCLSPIQSVSRPPLPAAELQRAKQKTVLISLYCILLILLFYQTPLASVGCWTILLHSMQLIIAKLIKKGGEQYEK